MAIYRYNLCLMPKRVKTGWQNNSSAKPSKLFMLVVIHLYIAVQTFRGTFQGSYTPPSRSITPTQHHHTILLGYLQSKPDLTKIKAVTPSFKTLFLLVAYSCSLKLWPIGRENVCSDNLKWDNSNHVSA